MAITFYATNNFTGDGTTVNWNINFADGYIDTTNVKARYLDNTGSYVDIAISSVAGNVVTISPAVANGQEFQIYRDTEKRFPLVDFSDGAILNETNLDTLATQAVMVSAEAFDQSNNGVRIAGDALTISQGIDDKAQEALDNSEAAVATADGIAGTANTALSNSQTALNTANDAKNTADGIAATANQALTNSNTAITTANGAVTTANAANTTANGIAATANSALTAANSAASDASLALSTANGVDAKAQTALDNTVALDAATMKKAANLSDIADRAAAWLNVRPIGSTPLAGEPVGDYDAATKRWVENLVSSGTVGPTMNGVMNYGVGDFHIRDSRAYKQPYEVYSDGQLLNRADWPELWAYAQMLTPITDAAWLASPSQRGKYSTGDGTTTFRVPDRNGVQSGSIPALFGRGDGGNSASAGTISDSGIPNITYVTPHSVVTLAGASSEVLVNGALQSITSADAPAPTGSDGHYISMNFDAARSSPVYGRSPSEVVPRNFVGVWVIRASGGFVAANTRWQVITKDSVRPPNGTKVMSGTVSTQYIIGEVLEGASQLHTDCYMDGTYYSVLSTYNRAKGVNKELAFDDTGTLNSDRYRARFGELVGFAGAGNTKGSFAVEDQNVASTFLFNSIISGAQSSANGYKTSTHLGNIHYNLSSFAQSTWVAAGDASGEYGARLAITPGGSDIFFTASIPGTSTTYTLQKSAISDSRQKHDIEPAAVGKAWDNLTALQFVTFVYNNDEQSRTRRGVIAQQAETVDPLYVKTLEMYDDEGTSYEQKQLDTTPMLLDTMHVVQTLMAKVEALEARIDELTSQ